MPIVHYSCLTLGRAWNLIENLSAFLKYRHMDDVNNISVTSVGCGSMIDYWSLVHALEMRRKICCSIRYVGIDKIDWNYKI